MPEFNPSLPLEVVAQDLGLSDADLLRRLAFVGYGSEDVPRIQAIRPIVEANAETLTSDFFDFLKGIS